jgi:hypothetical protein
MNELQLVVSVVTGLLGGALGGVLTAGTITRLSERSKARYAARTEVQGLLNRYRATIVYTEARMPATSSYPADYVDIRSQYELSRSVLAAARPLPRSTVAKLRSGLLELVGKTTVESAELLIDVPAERLDAEVESRRMFIEQHKLLRQPDAAKSEPLLRRLNANHSDGPVRERAIKELGDMIEAVKP